jgi:phosphomannomutase
MKLLLFDIDGTLCDPMETIDQPTIQMLQMMKAKGYHLGVVGGSDRGKAAYQLGSSVLDELLDHAFHENGSVYYKEGVLIAQDKIEDFIPSEKVYRLRELKMFLLKQLSCSGSPILSGTFIEKRTSMLNVSPCGRSCTPAERQAFYEWDLESGCRSKLVAAIRQEFHDLPLEIATGGQISIDIFPTGLDKTRCLKYVGETYDEIHFVGDKVDKGGNDYEIYNDPRVIGHRTTNTENTRAILASLIQRDVV